MAKRRRPPLDSRDREVIAAAVAFSVVRFNDQSLKFERKNFTGFADAKAAFASESACKGARKPLLYAYDAHGHDALIPESAYDDVDSIIQRRVG